MVVAARRLPAGPLTWRDLWRTPDDGRVYEIIDGVLHVSPAPIPLDQRVQFPRLTIRLDDVWAGRG